MTTRDVEDRLRELAPRVLGAVVRRYGHFDEAEDAVQEALLAAATRWPVDGVPDNPRGWLITVAARRLTDRLRADGARTRREDAAARLAPPPGERVPDADDTLILLFMCCHPALSEASQIALTLRAVGGLTTAEVARAFLVPEATMTRRITRAKDAIRDSGVPFRAPAPADRGARLAAVLHVLYLIFNEGYARERADLAAEAVRLTREVHRLLPDDPEVTGLLALMLLTDARRAARTAADGTPVPMAEQDRTRWDAARIAEGTALLADALPRGAPGPYQVQAAIAALHDEAPDPAGTDWPQIVALYRVLLTFADNPVVRLNHAVAVAMVDGPAAGLRLVDALAGPLAADHRLHAVRAHLLEMDGSRAEARAAYVTAAGLTMSPAQQRYLHRRAARLS